MIIPNRPIVARCARCRCEFHSAGSWCADCHAIVRGETAANCGRPGGREERARFDQVQPAVNLYEETPENLVERLMAAFRSKLGL